MRQHNTIHPLYARLLQYLGALPKRRSRRNDIIKHENCSRCLGRGVPWGHFSMKILPHSKCSLHIHHSLAPRQPRLRLGFPTSLQQIHHPPSNIPHNQLRQNFTLIKSAVSFPPHVQRNGHDNNFTTIKIKPNRS